MKNAKAFAIAAVAFLAGVTLRAAFAGGKPYPTNGWPVQPHMTQPPSYVEEHMCYLGTDGNLHLLPTLWSVPQ